MSETAQVEKWTSVSPCLQRVPQCAPAPVLDVVVAVPVSRDQCLTLSHSHIHPFTYRDTRENRFHMHKEALVA